METEFYAEHNSHARCMVNGIRFKHELRPDEYFPRETDRQTLDKGFFFLSTCILFVIIRACTFKVKNKIETIAV